jgi:hypothetical protein
MDKTSTLSVIKNQHEVKKSNTNGIRFLQAYCRAFQCVTTKHNDTITLWLN